MLRSHHLFCMAIYREKTIRCARGVDTDTHGVGIIIISRNSPHDSCGKKALNCPIFISHLKFVEKKHLHAALCSSGYEGSTVVRKQHRWLSTSGITIHLQNGSVKPYGSSQGDGNNVLPGRRTCRASSCLVFSLHIIKFLQMSWI
jgi:hypothetical protein